MTTDLSTLEPRALWHYFFELSQIPRGSKQEAAAAEWVAAQARSLGCEVARDKVGNVLIRKRAARGGESRPSVAMQAHVDMVCEKNEGTQHDFTKDPIRIRRDGDFLRATGTTLGADNGIGVASALAILADRQLAHGPLEVLITIDEETGLTGAKGLEGGWLQSKFLLNLDSEEEGELTIGCAGGVDTAAIRKITWEAAKPGSKALRIRALGLKGGHSGIDIHVGRANSIRVLAQILDELSARQPLSVASLGGGNKRNAIPREASAIVTIDSGAEREVRAQVAKLSEEWRRAFGAFDPNLAITVEDAQASRVMSPADTRALLGLLLAGPHGVEAMSPDIAGLVQTSTNMGLVETKTDSVEVCFLTRSSIDASRHALSQRIRAIAELAGFSVEHSNGYPGWKPEPEASIVKLVDRTHREVVGKPMIIKAIHAGLECGLIGEKYPDMEMASIGPSMWDVHTPDEHVSISSVERFFGLLSAILVRF